MAFASCTVHALLYPIFLDGIPVKLAGKLIKMVYESTKEEFLNAYDEACQKYLDGKVDKERFKKSYFIEIQNIVKNVDFKQKYDTQSTPYKATVKVYNEWFDLEQ